MCWGSNNSILLIILLVIRFLCQRNKPNSTELKVKKPGLFGNELPGEFSSLESQYKTGSWRQSIAWEHLINWGDGGVETHWGGLWLQVREGRALVNNVRNVKNAGISVAFFFLFFFSEAFLGSLVKGVRGNGIWWTMWRRGARQGFQPNC